MKKLLPVSVHDFKELIEKNYYYVDKTLFIKEIWERGLAVLLPRPRNFGKTLNLSMLRYFFEITDVSNEHLFVDKAIWEEPHLRAMHSTFSVIFLSFKGVSCATFEETYTQIVKLIAAEFERHASILSSDLFDSYNKTRFEKLRQAKAGNVEVSHSLDVLMRMLHKYYKKNVIVIIDDYDVPVQAAHLYGYYKEIAGFLWPLFTATFKDNNLLKKGILSGSLPLVMSDIFGGLNNLDVCTITSERMDDSFGFTREEAKELIGYYGFNQMDTFQKWYNGYTFGAAQGMFNPRSLMISLQDDGKCSVTYENDDALINRLISHSYMHTRLDLEALLKGESIEKEITDAIIFSELERDESLIWSILLYKGYLSYAHRELREGRWMCSLIVPNQETREVLQKLLALPLINKNRF